MKQSDLISINDLSASDVAEILELTARLKNELKSGKQHPLLAGKVLVMIFEKPSLRTRVTFEVGMFQLGGYALNLAPADIQLGKRESVGDVARNLERWVDGVMARVFDHKTIQELAHHAQIPVINGLSDREHPCQALTDFFTLREHKGSLRDLKLVFVGDGNNVAHSLMLLAPKTGTHFAIACPLGYEPDAEIWDEACALAEKSGTRTELFEDPAEALPEADAVYTDVWVSMGQEDETSRRRREFRDYQVNADLLKLAKPDAVVMHCLPAHRGEEITDEVLDGPQSIVLDQAENRLHTQKAILTLLLR